MNNFDVRKARKMDFNVVRAVLDIAGYSIRFVDQRHGYDYARYEIRNAEGVLLNQISNKTEAEYWAYMHLTGGGA